MSGMTGHIATAERTPANCAYPSRAAATHNPRSKKELGVNVSRQGSPSPSRLSLRARIQWVWWRKLPLQAKRNWLTTKFYMARCEALRRKVSLREIVRSWARPNCPACHGSRRQRYSDHMPSWLTRTCPFCVVEMPPDANGYPANV